MQSIILGDVRVTRITEREGCAPETAQLAPEGGREVWERHSSWLAPRFWNRESNDVVTCSASYLVRSADGAKSHGFSLGSSSDVLLCTDLSKCSAKGPLVSLRRNQEDQ
jgi:outer membrane protein assembly factor BamB